jgi:hypothetical protein
MLNHLYAYLRVEAIEIRDRARLARQADGGYSTEAIAVIAFLVALALAALAILGPKILDKIRSVKL